jgi:SOS-response transcriptional repressor LexA
MAKMSKRALVIEQLRRHPGRSQTAAEIAYALNLPDGRSVALQLKWLERQGIIRAARRGQGSKSMDGGRPQWMLPSSERAYRLVQK